MLIDKLEQAINAGDRHEIRQALADIIMTGDIEEFVTWVELATDETLRSVTPELQITEMSDGSLFLELLEDVKN